MADLSVKVCGVEFNNPLIAASGTFGFGMEYSELYPLEKLGGISCKGITLTRRDGNPCSESSRNSFRHFECSRTSKPRC